MRARPAVRSVSCTHGPARVPFDDGAEAVVARLQRERWDLEQQFELALRAAERLEFAACAQRMGTIAARLCDHELTLCLLVLQHIVRRRDVDEAAREFAMALAADFSRYTRQARGFVHDFASGAWTEPKGRRVRAELSALALGCRALFAREALLPP